MHILLVSGPEISLKEPFNSGIESFIVSLANELIHEGYSADVIAQEANPDAKFNLVNPFTSKTSDFLKRQKEIYEFRNLDVDKYDVVHYNMFYPHLLQAGLNFNKPSVLTLHSPADQKRVSAYKKIKEQSDLTFIAISDRIKTQWDNALETNMPLIHNGIDLNLWPTNFSRKGEYLLWSARINEEKNTAAAIHLAQHMNMPLKIAGRIVDKQYFENQVAPHLNTEIEYLGHLTQRELSKLAEKATAYLATATWQEPFGLAALEMLASGVPVIGFHTAVPPGWKHESVLISQSNNWENLTGLIEASSVVSPIACKAFAASMSVQNMTANYIRLYQQKIRKKSILKIRREAKLLSPQTQTVI